MKNSIPLLTLAVGALLVTPLWASYDVKDLGPYKPRFYFSTWGEDRYSDGELALSGECYALVWQRDGVEFRGFNATGTYGIDEGTTLPVDPKNCHVVHVWPAAVHEWIEADPEFGIEEGYWTSYCPGASNSLDRSYYVGHTNGTFSIYLFDTRVKSGDATIVSGCDTAHKTVPVLNGYGQVSFLSNITMVEGSDWWGIWGDREEFKSDAVPDYGDVTFDEEGWPADQQDTYASTQSAVPSNAPTPYVSTFSYDGTEAKLTVTNAPSYLRFSVVAADSLQKLEASPETVGGEKQGANSLQWTIPSTDASAFFKIIRPPLSTPAE